MSYGSSTCTTKFILVFRILSWYYGAYTCISDFIHVLQNIYMYFRSYTCLTEYLLVLRNLYWSYGTYTGLTKLIIVLRNLLLSYGSHSGAKVPVGTISRNKSGSSHIQGQIKLLHIRTFVFRRYKSQIHYTEVPVGTTGLILILQNLYLFFRFRTYTYFSIREYP